MIDWRSDLVLRGFDQAQAQVPRRVLDAVEVARDASLGRKHQHRAAMCKELRLRIVGIAKSDRVGERADRLLGAGQKMPAVRIRAPRISADIDLFLSRGQLRTFGWVDAHADDVELTARAEGHRLEAADQAIEDLGAQHRAVVINQREDDWLPAEILSQAHSVASLIAEHRVKRRLRVELLIDADVAQWGGQGRPVGGRSQQGRRSE